MSAVKEEKSNISCIEWEAMIGWFNLLWELGEVIFLLTVKERIGVSWRELWDERCYRGNNTWRFWAGKKHSLLTALNGEKEWEEAPDYFSLDLRQSEVNILLVCGDAGILAWVDLNIKPMFFPFKPLFLTGSQETYILAPAVSSNYITLDKSPTRLL